MTHTNNAAFWDNLAEKYSRQPVADPAAFERKIAITQAHLRPGHLALDIGCGTGSLALRLAETGAQIHGLDYSREMIRIATAKAARQNVPNVHFHVGPFDESFSAFPAGSLNVICAYSLLHLVPDRDATLARMFRLLKPGGVLVTSTVCLGGSWVPYRPLLALMRAFGKAPEVALFSKAMLESDVQRAGFADVSQPDVGADKTISFLVARKPDGIKTAVSERAAARAPAVHEAHRVALAPGAWFSAERLALG